MSTKKTIVSMAKGKVSTETANAGAQLLVTTFESRKASADVWADTGKLVLTLKGDIESLPKDAKASDVRDVILTAWTKSVDGDVPETGLNGKGQKIDLRHDGSRKDSPKGMIKFSAWQETRRTAQGISTISKAIANQGFSKTFPKGSIMGKTEAEQVGAGNAEGSTESAYKTFKRSIKLMTDKLTELEDIKEITNLDAQLAEFMMAYSVHTNAQKAKAMPKASNA